MKVPFRKGGDFDIADGERFAVTLTNSEGETVTAQVSPEELAEMVAEGTQALAGVPHRAARR